MYFFDAEAVKRLSGLTWRDVGLRLGCPSSSTLRNHVKYLSPLRMRPKFFRLAVLIEADWLAELAAAEKKALTRAAERGYGPARWKLAHGRFDFTGKNCGGRVFFCAACEQFAQQGLLDLAEAEIMLREIEQFSARYELWLSELPSLLE